VIRSDSGFAHRLSLNGRVLSTVVCQVKAKTTTKTGEEAPLEPTESALKGTRKAHQKQATGRDMATEPIFHPGNTGGFTSD
jgi:hypothetical protein